MPEDNAPSASSLIFKDDSGQSLKFFITRGRHRKEARELIQEHGGIVSEVDSRDVFLRLGEPGSKTSDTELYSTELITDSVAAGRLLAHDVYSLNKDGLASSNRKISRQPFTSQDKIVLRDYIVNFCTTNPEGAKNLNGNRLYKDLARRFPNHSWQSWRSHAIDSIIPTLKPNQLRPSSNVPQSQSAPGPSQSGSSSRRAATDIKVPNMRLSRETQEVVQELLRICTPRERTILHVILAEAFPPTTPETFEQWIETTFLPELQDEETLISEIGAIQTTLSKNARVDFTEADRALMRRHTRLLIRSNASLKSPNFWKPFASKYPHHTAESWRGHFRGRVAKTLSEAARLRDIIRSNLRVARLAGETSQVGVQEEEEHVLQTRENHSVGLEINNETAEQNEDENEEDDIWQTQAPGMQMDLDDDTAEAQESQSPADNDGRSASSSPDESGDPLSQAPETQSFHQKSAPALREAKYVPGSTAENINSSDDEELSCKIEPLEDDSFHEVDSSTAVQESDKLQYLYNKEFDNLCRVFAPYGCDRESCLRAVHAAGGHIPRARMYLRSRVKSSQLSKSTRRHLYTPQEDAILLRGYSGAFDALKARKGRDSIANRFRFLHYWNDIDTGDSISA
ncbi:hypothetical protein DFS34DRAFT_647442 [Phlyctochytrium arcticum]|nr:hypothetical protein DFS34DRAFT_647442 [Phlyctochytrium arcticum]